MAKIKGKSSRLMYFIKDKETIVELFSGNEPHLPGGTFSQGWSVASMIEILCALNDFSLRNMKQKK